MNASGQRLPGALLQRPPVVICVGSGDVGLRARRLLGEQGIEIDELRIVWLGFAVEPCAAMKMHQGLHAAGVEMVHMLMLQRYGSSALGSPTSAKAATLRTSSPSRQSKGWSV